MHGDTLFFHDFIYLLAAVISVPLAKRLGLGSVLGYLIAGVVIGPFCFGLVGENQSDVMHFAEFGVVMMLFLVGLELQPSLLWKMRGPILGLGGLQIVATATVVVAIALLSQLPMRTGIAIGLTLALSSTAIVLQTLKEKGQLQTEAGRNAFSVLLMQDIAVIPILAFLPLLAIQSSGLAETHETGTALSGWRHALLVLAVIATIIIGGRFAMRHVLRFIAQSKMREVFTAAALLLVVAVTLAMQKVGLSPALGTFLAGVVLADSEYRHELESDVEPFKGLLMGLFFIAVGASINFELLQGQPLLIGTIVLGLISLKFAVLMCLGRIFRMPLSDRFLFSFSLAQGSEFAFVLLSYASAHHVLDEDTTGVLLLAVALSMVATPLLMILNDTVVQPRFRDVSPTPEADEIPDSEAPVIIAGFGRFGQIVGRLLIANGVEPTVLDHDPTQIDALRRFGHKVFYGNAARLDLLHAAGAERASILVIAVEDADTALHIVDTVRKHFPHLKIVARAKDRLHAYQLLQKDVTLIRRETFDAALELGIDTLRELGQHPYQARRMGQIFRKHDQQALEAMSAMFHDEQAHIDEAQRQRDELQALLRSEHDTPDIEPDRAWDVSEVRDRLKRDDF